MSKLRNRILAWLRIKPEALTTYNQPPPPPQPKAAPKCDHRYVLDNQILVIRCDKCKDQRWIKMGNLWPSGTPFVRSEN